MVYRLRFEDADVKNVSIIGRFITKKKINIIIAYVNMRVAMSATKNETALNH